MTGGYDVTLTHNPVLLWYVGGYAALMVALGIFYSKKITTSEDFILAGRGLGTWVLMGTLLATWCGSGTVTGGGNSRAYSQGLWPAMMGIVMSPIGILIMYKIAPKVRAFGKYTVSEILEIKYGSFARILAGIIIILAYVGIVSYQFKGLAFILNVTTGISVEVGTILAAALIIFLATIGGLMSVAPTDALSAFLMIGALVIAVPVVLTTAGGWENICANVPPSHLTLTGNLTPLQLLGYLLPGLFLMLSDQNMYQRLASSKGDRNSQKAMIGWLVGLLLISPSVVIIAFAARSMFDNIAPGMALISTTLVMPTVIGGILLAGATAFIVTTGNSYLLSAATNVTYDIYGKYINPNASDRKKLVFTKVLIVLLGIFSFFLIRFFPTILSVQMYAYTMYGASLTPAVLAVFFWDKVTKQGGVASMLAGAITTLFWEMVLKRPYGMNSVLVAVPVAVIVLIVVTKLTYKKPGVPVA